MEINNLFGCRKNYRRQLEMLADGPASGRGVLMRKLLKILNPGKLTLLFLLFALLILGDRRVFGQDAGTSLIQPVQPQQMVMSQKQSQLYFQNQSCNSARQEFRRWSEDVRKACGDYGSGENCVAQANMCAEAGSYGASGGWATLSQALGAAGSQYFGGGALMNSPVMGTGSASARCKTSRSIENLKRAQERMYDQAKDSYENARQAATDIEREADDLTKRREELLRQYQTSVKEARKVNANMPRLLQEKRDEYEKKAAELMKQMDEGNQQVAAAMSDKAMAESAITQLYPVTMGACMDILQNKKITNDKELLELQLNYESQVDSVSDLRQKEAIRQRLLRNLQIQEQMRQRDSTATYNQCMTQAKLKYNADYGQLKAKIAEDDRIKVNTTKALDIAQMKLKALPQQLAKELQAIQDEIDAENSFTKQDLNNTQSSITNQISNFNARYVRAKQFENSTQMKFTQEEASYRQTQAIAEASLGDVGALVGDYRMAKDAMCEACRDPKSGKRPTQCGSDAFDSYEGGGSDGSL